MRIMGLFTVVLCFFLSGCSKFEEEAIERSAVSGIIAKSVNGKIPAPMDEISKSIVFTGADILWFNESTKEIRFKDNLSMQSVFTHVQEIEFYIESEYLFSAVYVNSLNSQIINSLVFYYNILENKYFLLDGYPPDTSVISGLSKTEDLTNDHFPDYPPDTLFLDPQQIQDLRDKNMQNIEPAWTKFIDQLKKETRLKR